MEMIECVVTITFSLSLDGLLGGLGNTFKVQNFSSLSQLFYFPLDPLMSSPPHNSSHRVATTSHGHLLEVS